MAAQADHARFSIVKWPSSPVLINILVCDCCQLLLCLHASKLGFPLIIQDSPVSIDVLQCHQDQTNLNSKSVADAADACSKGGAPAPQGQPQALKQGSAAGHGAGMQSPAWAAAAHPNKVPAASHCAVDPIEAPAPAWTLDPTITHEPQSPPPTLAYSSISHIPNTYGEGESSKARHAWSDANPKVQGSSSGRSDAAWLAKASQQGSSALLPAMSAVTQVDSVSSASRQGKPPERALPGSFSKKVEEAELRGFAADTDNAIANGSLSSGEADAPEADAAGVQRLRATYCAAAVQSKEVQQGSQQSGSAAFAGFDVPEEQADESTAAESAVANQRSSLQTDSPAASRTVSEVWAQNNPGRVGSAALLSETQTKTGTSAVTLARPEGSFGTNQASVGSKAERTSSAVFSRSPTQDIPSEKGEAAGAVRVLRIGQGYKRGKSAQAAAPAGPNSGIVCAAWCLIHSYIWTSLCSVIDIACQNGLCLRLLPAYPSVTHLPAFDLKYYIWCRCTMSTDLSSASICYTLGMQSVSLCSNTASRQNQHACWIVTHQIG